MNLLSNEIISCHDTLKYIFLKISELFTARKVPEGKMQEEYDEHIMTRIYIYIYLLGIKFNNSN